MDPLQGWDTPTPSICMWLWTYKKGAILGIQFYCSCFSFLSLYTSLVGSWIHSHLISTRPLLKFPPHIILSFRAMLIPQYQHLCHRQHLLGFANVKIWMGNNQLTLKKKKRVEMGEIRWGSPWVKKSYSSVLPYTYRGSAHYAHIPTWGIFDVFSDF